MEIGEMGFNFSYELVLSPAIRLHRVTSKNADYIFEELSSIQTAFFMKICIKGPF